MSSMGMYQKEYILENDEYNNWGSDDDYIKNYICNKETYLGRHCNVEEKPTTVLLQDDNISVHNDGSRSVHNPNDVATIQTLQEQLDAQALKLKTITDLLFKNGAI